jgi:predicted DNA binding CopG/RHH family protein
VAKVKKKVRTRSLTIRISDADYRTLTERAEEAGLSQSEYIRLLIRRAKIRLNVNVEV